MKKVSIKFRIFILEAIAFVGSLFRNASKEPNSLKQALSMGKVWILYQKVGGNVSEYISTRNLNLIPTHDHPKGTGKTNDNQLSHYNLKEGNEGWKSISYLKGKVLDWQFIG